MSITKRKKRSQSRQLHIIMSSVCSEEQIDEWDLKSSEILVDIDRVGRTPTSNFQTTLKNKISKLASDIAKDIS